MSKLSEFLAAKLSDRGKQSSFARRINRSQGTVSRWVNGESVPDYESFLRISDEWGLDPIELFQMAGREDYERLFRKFSPDYEPKKLTESDLYKNPGHAELHERIQYLCQKGLEDEIENHIAHYEDRSETLFRLREIVRLSKATGGALYADDGGYWIKLESVNLDGTEGEISQLIQENPDDWVGYKTRYEGEEYATVLFVFLQQPTMEPYLEKLTEVYLNDWLENYLEEHQLSEDPTILFKRPQNWLSRIFFEKWTPLEGS